VGEGLVSTRSWARGSFRHRGHRGKKEVTEKSRDNRSDCRGREGILKQELASRGRFGRDSFFFFLLFSVSSLLFSP